MPSAGSARSSKMRSPNNGDGKRVPMNLDGVGAVVVLDTGLDWRTTRMFLITPRSVSMGAHYIEEQDQDSTWRHIPADWIDYD